MKNEKLRRFGKVRITGDSTKTNIQILDFNCTLDNTLDCIRVITAENQDFTYNQEKLIVANGVFEIELRCNL